MSEDFVFEVDYEHPQRIFILINQVIAFFIQLWQVEEEFVL
jgi:hypothetical protein